jgi:hypothetical protein
VALDNALQSRLIAAIEARAGKRGLTGDLVRFRYANRYVFGDKPKVPRARALYVGVGHGLDALLALVDGECTTIVGVDPYVSKDGNDEEDYAGLVALIEALGLGGRFELHRMSVDTYLASPRKQVDCVIVNDVLHHIFVTREALSTSPHFSGVERLFRSLRGLSSADARLVVGEMSRSGLRPSLSHYRLFRPRMKYHTKQNWHEWDKAITAAGWSRTRVADYVPFRVRGLRGLLSPLTRYTLLDRYVLVYQPTPSP